MHMRSEGKRKRSVLDRLMLWSVLLYFVALFSYGWNSTASLHLINGWLPYGLVMLLLFTVIGILIGWYLIFIFEKGTGL